MFKFQNPFEILKLCFVFYLRIDICLFKFIKHHNIKDKH